MKAFCDGAGFDWTGRVRYVDDIPRIKPQKDSVFIIDESDERIFRDYKTFYGRTKAKTVRTICLTATACDSNEDCLEKACLEALEIKTYMNSKESKDFTPVLHSELDLSTIDKQRALISKESESCGVLIYANGDRYKVLAEEEGVTKLADVTDLNEIEHMDEKKLERYPRYLINDEFGGRGLNFRAKSPS